LVVVEVVAVVTLEVEVQVDL
jgi:hypothetical protein